MIMVVCYLAAAILDRKDDLWNTLALAALGILFMSPLSLFDASFQLTFGAVAAIICVSSLTPTFARNRGDRAEGRHRFPVTFIRWAAAFCLVTVAALLGTAPIAAFHFHRVALWGIVTNLVVVPVVGFLIVPLCLLSCSLVWLSPPLAGYVTGVASVIVELLVEVVSVLSALPLSRLRVVTPSLFQVAFFYGGLALVVKARESRLARLGALAALLSCLVLGGFQGRGGLSGTDLRITFIDVGQGESILVEFPGKTLMLIDGGGFYDDRFDVGERVVSPFLWKKKIRRLDLVVLTHPHPDHLNGLISIVDNFGAREVWTGGDGGPGESYGKFDAIVREKGITHIPVGCGREPVELEGVRIDFLNPCSTPCGAELPETESCINNRSVVLKLTYGEVSFLLTGDIEEEAERALVEAGADLRSEVLKVPHHGSLTSSSTAFLDRTNPKLAVFTTGFRNMFHLPSAEIVRRYEERGCAIYRTDLHGAITVVTDGHRLSVDTVLEPQGMG
jgi:competence protein ComEC